MALFTDTLAQEITTLIRQRYTELGIALGKQPVQENSDRLDGQRSLQHDLKLLIGAANGEYHREDTTVLQVEQALKHLLDLLLWFNSQQNKRVLRPQVERLRDLRRLPE